MEVPSRFFMLAADSNRANKANKRNRTNPLRPNAIEASRDTLEQEGLTLHALTGYHAMLEAAVATRYLKPGDLSMLERWHDDPENWMPPATPND